jgi:hypothetical protein
MGFGALALISPEAGERDRASEFPILHFGDGQSRGRAEGLAGSGLLVPHVTRRLTKSGWRVISLLAERARRSIFRKASVRQTDITLRTLP